jgi:hypothetical protein
MKDKKRKISVLSLQSTGSHTKQGWLKKQGGRHKNWKSRLFILAENILYYFKTEKDREPKGLIPLSADCKIEFIDETETSKKGNANTAPEKWSFKIRTPWRVYWLCNENIQEISSWVSVLNMATKVSIYFVTLFLVVIRIRIYIYIYIITILSGLIYICIY